MSAPSAYDQWMLELVNIERAKVGAQPLAWLDNLGTTSEDHSQKMLRDDEFAHGNPLARLNETNYNWNNGSYDISENISWSFDSGKTTAQEVKVHVDGYMNSQSHREAMLKGSYEVAGMGVESGGFNPDGTFDYNPTTMSTQHFLENNFDSFLIATAFKDANNNNRFDYNEGVNARITVKEDGAVVAERRAFDSGGFFEELGAGTYKVVANWNGMKMTDTVTLGGMNKEIEFDF